MPLMKYIKATTIHVVLYITVTCENLAIKLFFIFSLMRPLIYVSSQPLFSGNLLKQFREEERIAQGNCTLVFDDEKLLQT